MCAQPRFRSACAFAQSDQNLQWGNFVQRRLVRLCVRYILQRWGSYLSRVWQKCHFLALLFRRFIRRRTLTLKAPRKTAFENIVCLCRLLNFLADFSNLVLHTDKQCGPRSKEQSDLGPHCLQKWRLKSQADDKADDNCCDWRFKG